MVVEIVMGVEEQLGGRGLWRCFFSKSLQDFFGLRFPLWTASLLRIRDAFSCQEGGVGVETEAKGLLGRGNAGGQTVGPSSWPRQLQLPSFSYYCISRKIHVPKE
jgi:hypothetical protein